MVIGGAVFISSHLVAELLKADMLNKIDANESPVINRHLQ